MKRPFLVLAMLAFTAPALAQEDSPVPEAEAGPTAPPTGQGLDLTAEISLLSDFRFRGVSRSDEDPTVAAALGLVHDSGFYAGLRATAIEGNDDFLRRNPGFTDLGDVQVDFYAGLGGRLVDGFEYDAGVQYYLFAGGAGPTDYVEPYASLSYLIGPVFATVGAKYAPAQSALGDEDMLYLFGQVDVTIPFRPWSLSARVGRQSWGLQHCGVTMNSPPCAGGAPAISTGSYWTWSLGVEHHLQLAGLPNTTIGLAYVDTSLGDAPGAGAGLVASLRLAF